MRREVSNSLATARNNPELFGNPAKSKQPSKRSQKSSSEYRQNQEVPDDWSYKSDDPDNEESDDLGSPGMKPILLIE